jgi:CHAT domain-containing protein
VKEAELRAAVAAFRDFSNLSDTRLEGLKQLNDWLIIPLKRHIRTPVLGIIPNGILHYLPFAALTDGKGYLGERYTLVYLPSASALPFIKQRDKPLGARALVVAGARAEGSAVLRHVMMEAQAIADLYETRAFTDGSMSVAEFMKRAGGYSIVHIAAHAELNPSNPLFSQIVLGRGKEGGETLTVNDVYGMSLDETGLVVLSACDTNLGSSYSKGDDLVALNRAFIYAGSPAVLASLWSVDDESTSELMQAFYANLKRGVGRAEALRAAQSAVRKKYPHPYYWAGFILTESPRAK